jgi:arsenate reductase
MTGKPAILVLCTGNSCRSQMAEGFLRHHAGDRFEVYSAGTEPAERVHPLSAAVMGERGIDLTGQEPKHVRDFLGVVPIHTAIIVCDGANQTCPAVWPGARERLFWPFEDPASFQGTEEEKLAKFRAIRDEIETKILGWLESEGPGF